jgi:hypothetical protein
MATQGLYIGQLTTGAFGIRICNTERMVAFALSKSVKQCHFKKETSLDIFEQRRLVRDFDSAQVTRNFVREKEPE